MLRVNAYSRDTATLAESPVYDKDILAYFYDNNNPEGLLNTAMKHRVIVCTCITAGRLESVGFPAKFTHIFGPCHHAIETAFLTYCFSLVDEISQCTEPESMIPLMLAQHTTRVIYAGDHQQLGPIIRSPVASVRAILGRSVMERMMNKETGSPVYQLSSSGEYNRQYITNLVDNYRYD